MFRAVPAMSLILWAQPAFAITVAVVQPAHPSATLAETISRLHGELLAVGLDVTFIALPSRDDGNRSAWLESVAEERNLDALVEIVGEGEARTVDVWVRIKPDRRLVVSNVSLEGHTNNSSERLAVRAVEVIRSTLLANDLSVRERSQAPAKQLAATPDARPATEALRRHPTQFGIELGAAALWSLDRLGPAILPLVRFDYAALPPFTITLSLAGFGVHPSVATAQGSATVAQQFVVLGGHYRIGPNPTFFPFIGLSAGALHTSVEAQANSPNHGHSVDSWSLLIDANLGARLQLHERYFLSASMHCHLAQSYVAIHFEDSIVATTGRPNLAAVLNAGAWL